MSKYFKFVSVGLVVLAVIAFTASTSWAVPGKAPKPDRAPSHTIRQERPIPLGVSGGSVTDLANGYCCSGTLGALVKDSAGIQYILSNTHVFAGDSAAGGNGVVSQVGDPINQPGYVDVACQDIEADYVATLSDWVDLVPEGTSTVDAAIAAVIPGQVDPSGSILEIGTISAETAPAYVNQPVKKSGRTSGLTTAKVVGLNADITVQYEDECAGNPFVTTFTGQIIVSPGKFLKAGDSGSLMVENVVVNPKAVGLLYAGSNKVAIANPIQDVLNAFGVTMVGVPSAPSSLADPLAAAVENTAKVKEKHDKQLASLPKSVGHAVGVSNGRPVILLLVEQVTPELQQSAPTDLDGIPVEIMEVGRIVAY